MGPQGPQGAQGPAGARGASAFDPIPSGKTVYGTMVLDEWQAYGDNVTIYSNLPAPAPVNLSFDKIIIKATLDLLYNCSGMKCLTARHQANQSFCSGTVNNPTAAPGYLCIYPTLAAVEMADDSLDANSIGWGESLTSRLGFYINYESTASRNQDFQAVWAYTAP
jgi:hypothetical protein